MRYYEISSGFRLPISAEEQEIMNKVGLAGCAEPDLGDERAHEVARRLMMRGLLHQIDKHGVIHYRQKSVHDVWVDRD